MNIEVTDTVMQSPNEQTFPTVRMWADDVHSSTPLVVLFVSQTKGFAISSVPTDYRLSSTTAESYIPCNDTRWAKCSIVLSSVDE